MLSAPGRALLPMAVVVAALLLVFCGPPVAEQELGEPLVVFTFDDADTTIYTLAYPIMRAYDPSWTATHFLPVVYPGIPGNVTIAELQEMERGGWETGGHGYTHQNLSSLPPDSARWHVAASDSFLRANGLSHESYAYAYGNYNDTVQSIVAERFRNIRTSHDFKYLDGVNRLELGAYDGKAGQTADDLIGRIEEAKLIGSPLVVFCFHEIVPDSAQPSGRHGAWWTRESAFRGLLDYLRSREMPAMSVRRAMEVLVP
jgi:peptidoglycan/xylan/chitin deacetylase (PgdA/CDA1 family)